MEKTFACSQCKKFETVSLEALGWHVTLECKPLGWFSKLRALARSRMARKVVPSNPYASLISDAT